MEKRFFKLLNWVREKFPDPVRDCHLYNEQGCSHVDGLLCDFPECSMEHKYIISKPDVNVKSQCDFDLECEAAGINDSNVENIKDTAFISIIGTPEILESYLNEPNTEHWFKEEHSNVLNLEFDDVSKDRTFEYENGYGEKITIHAFAMSKEQAKKCVDFIENNLGKNFKIHCRAGVSRSAAVGEFITQMYEQYQHIKLMGTPNSGVLADLKNEFYRRNNMFV